MDFLRKLFGKKDDEKKPTVSTARQPTSPPVKTQGGRRVCSGYGRTEEKILKDFAEARKRGVIVIGSGGSGLLYCDNDKNFFVADAK